MLTRETMRSLIGALALAGLAACTDTASPVEALEPSTDPILTDVTPALVATLDEAYQEENLALYTYRGVIANYGARAPFRSIEPSESTHVAAVGHLYTRLGLAAPASVWSVGNVEHFATFTAACAGGVAIEIADAALYDRLLLQALPDAVVQVFTNLRRASLEHHLPAFTKCQ